MAKVRGILYTLSSFFLVMLVVSLSLLLTTALQQSNSRLMESGSLERLYSLDTSLVRVLNKIDNGIDSDLSWDDTNNVTILTMSEYLNTDFNNYANNFNSEVQSLSSFIESDQSEISFDLSLIYNSVEKIPIVINPTNFKYTHLNQGGENILTIYPGGFLPSINFYLELPNSTISGTGSILWSIQNPGTDLLFNISVVDKNGVTDTIQQALNSTLKNEFSVEGDVTITIGELCSGCIQLDRAGINVDSTFSSEFIYSGELVTLHYPKGTYKINFSDIGVFLNASPRIL